MFKSKAFCTFLWFLTCSGIFPWGMLSAQQPAYFVFGAQQFRGLQIYDLIQDEESNFLISTNEGLFRYDFHQFERIGCKAAKSNSFFNFVIDPAGNVYCNNINHQVFIIKGKDCQLFYELKEAEAGTLLDLAVGNRGELILSSKALTVLDPAGRAMGRFNSGRTFWGEPHTAVDGAVFYHLPGSDTVVRYSGGKFVVHRLGKDFDHGSPTTVVGFFNLGQLTFGLDMQSKALYKIDERTFEVEKMPPLPLLDNSYSLRLYPAGDKVWIAGALPGTVLLSWENGQLRAQGFYEDHFISHVFHDLEGNYLLSTFDQGILVIPDLGIPDVIDDFWEDPVSSLLVHPRGGELFMGTSKGRVLRHDGKGIQVVSADGQRTIDAIHGSEGFPYLLFDDRLLKAMAPDGNLRTVEMHAVLKDVAFIDSKTAYLGTNVGMLRLTVGNQGTIAVNPVPGLEFRIHFMELDARNQSILASTSKGLLRIDLDGGVREIKHKEQGIYPTAMATHKGRNFLATRNDGILLLQGDVVVDSIRPEISGQESIHKLILMDDHFLAKSSHGIYQFSYSGKLKRNIGKEFGFPNTRVFDMALQGKRLWVSHGGGVQRIDLAYTSPATSPPRLRIAQVMVNDSLVDAGSDGSFSSDQRKFRFELASPTLRNRDNLRIHYRLDGNDGSWTVKPNDESSILYNAVGPGSYTFMAKAENQGNFGEVVTYRFHVAAPFYQRWWFFMSVALALTGTVSLVYRRQMRIQDRKARQTNELNASKLTAIQSQMNPHFIFNALNSIQDLILKGDVEHSYSYITTFSNLVRNALKYSERDFIDFEEEIRLLELYLSLEKLRFKQDLEYSIEEDIDPHIQLPPLLIQPFVENALLHGLLHKPGKKVLKINFELKDSLICTIEDNGIGREEAREIRERQRGDHESFSGKAIRNRFDILSEVFQGQFGYEYEDLKSDGKPAGTRITLKIPVKRRF